jgi:hypothetical protein
MLTALLFISDANIQWYLPVCRPSISSKRIELYPESLEISDQYGSLLLHVLLCNIPSSPDVALMVIKKYPAALRHQNNVGHLSLQLLRFS